MITTGITQEAFMASLEVKLDTNYTEEQKQFITTFGDKPTFCFADPGTGKTYSAIGGLLNAELFKSIPGNEIYALSFTRLATAELAIRHETACKKLGISRTVNFATLHSLCRTILMKNYRLLGMSKFDSTGQLTMEKSYIIVENSLEEEGISLEPNKIRACIRASNTLNAALIFDQDNVESKMAFKECNVPYEIFDRVRGMLFSYSLLTETISVSDLLLYTLMLMKKHPEVSVNFKSKCKLMLVDEAQDLSLLQLQIVSMLTDCPIFIGDMKQQIYAFNGACQETVQAFERLFPNNTKLQLTRSFRCRNEIADYATKIILPNNIGGENYKGIGAGGTVSVISGLYQEGADIESISKELKREFTVNSHKFEKDYLFLARNNISLIPVVEELFKQELPFRVNKYTMAFEIPVIKEMVELIQLCAAPMNPANVIALNYLIPEFRGYHTLKKHPFYNILKEYPGDIFEINYQFKDAYTGAKAMSLLMEIQSMLESNAEITDIFNKLWSMYEENWVKYTSWRLEAKPEYYIRSVNSLTHKTYQQFVNDEVMKNNIIQESERYNRGVRCYTMHASKGLEADIVYIIDANEGLIPNISKLNKMIEKGCDMDAARAIREERSLCYVACTRAKEELHIISTDKPAEMLLGNNVYSQYDDVYQYYTNQTDDIKAFECFVERYISL